MLLRRLAKFDQMLLQRKNKAQQRLKSIRSNFAKFSFATQLKFRFLDSSMLARFKDTVGGIQQVIPLYDNGEEHLMKPLFLRSRNRGRRLIEKSYLRLDFPVRLAFETITASSFRCLVLSASSIVKVAINRSCKFLLSTKEI